MSPLAKYLLERVDNDFKIDLNRYFGDRVERINAKVVCLFLGINIIGGS